MDKEIAEDIGNSIAKATLALKEMSIDLSIMAAEMAIDLTAGKKLQPDHKEYIRRKLEEYSDENMGRYIAAIDSSWRY